jgi:Protein of unknown function DUF115
MSVFEDRFPYHYLLFQDQTISSCVTPVFEANKEHVFVFGPVCKKSIEFLDNLIKKNPKIRIFWNTACGNLSDIEETILFFEHEHLYLYDIDDPEKLAFLYAKNLENLSFDVLDFSFVASNSLFKRTLCEKVVLFFYIQLELKNFRQVVEHIHLNIKETKETYSISQKPGVFHNQPLFLIGAGRSLDDLKDLLKTHQDHMNIMAIGTAIGILADLDIHYSMACHVCPNEESLKRLEGKIKPDIFFSSLRCHHGLYKQAKGKKVLFPINSALGFEILTSFFNDCPVTKLMPMESSTILSLALAIAIHLGFNPIILGGIDLSSSYAHGIESSLECERFYPERQALETLARNSKSTIYRFGQDSLFSDIKPISIDEITKLIGEKQKLSLDNLKEGIEFKELPLNTYSEDLQKSFKTCLEKWDWMLREVHLEDELAYKEFLKHVDEIGLFTPLFES